MGVGMGTLPPGAGPYRHPASTPPPAKVNSHLVSLFPQLALPCLFHSSFFSLSTKLPPVHLMELPRSVPLITHHLPLALTSPLLFWSRLSRAPRPLSIVANPQYCTVHTVRLSRSLFHLYKPVIEYTFPNLSSPTVLHVIHTLATLSSPMVSLRHPTQN